MTYKQILQIENYITEIESLRNLQIDSEELFNRAETLDKKIASSVKGYSPRGVDWDNASTYLIDSCYYDSKLIKNYLSIMSASLTSILNSIAIYPLICEIREDIQEGENLDDEDKAYYITKISEKYSNCISFSKGVQNLVQNTLAEKWVDENTVDSLHGAVLEKLRLYLHDLCSSQEKSRQNKKTTPQINVVQNNNQSNNQQFAVDFKVSVEECYKSLDDCETLSQNETDEIKKQLDEIQNLLKDKKGKKKTIKEKLSSMLKWVADKGTDAMIALLPTLVSILTNLQAG